MGSCAARVGPDPARLVAFLARVDPASARPVAVLARVVSAPARPNSIPTRVAGIMVRVVARACRVGVLEAHHRQQEGTMKFL